MRGGQTAGEAAATRVAVLERGAARGRAHARARGPPFCAVVSALPARRLVVPSRATSTPALPVLQREPRGAIVHHANGVRAAYAGEPSSVALTIALAPTAT